MTEPWVHYAREQLDEFPGEVEPSIGQSTIKPASWCLHFARGTQWRDWAHENLTPRGYTRKYELANLDELQIFVIDARFAKSFPLDRSYAVDWAALSYAGYDGVLVCRDEIMAAFAYPEPWYIFASARESDELVIWRNAQLRERKFDWPKEYFLRSHAREMGLASEWKANNMELFTTLIQTRELVKQNQ